MISLIEAAFRNPPRTSTDIDSTTFAVLPQNTSDELNLSEIHSKLDWALNFLQRDVGYALLDDARPHVGGGVRLRLQQRNLLAAPKLDPSAKISKQERHSRTRRSWSESTELLADSSSAVLEDSVVVQLRAMFDRGDGHVRSSKLAEEICCGPFQNLGRDLERVFRDISIKEQDREITLQEFEALLVASSCSTLCALPDSLQNEVPMISPEVSKYAYYQCDLVLVSRFVRVLAKTGCPHLGMQNGISTKEAKSCIESLVEYDGLYKCALQGVRLMHLCNYEYADVILVLAYASVYFQRIFASIGKKMTPDEAAHVIVLLMYLAHAFLLDETCRLKIWQKHIFKKYCTLKVLDAALFRLFKMLDFKLNIRYEDERTALLGLSGLNHRPTTYLKVSGGELLDSPRRHQKYSKSPRTLKEMLGNEPVVPLAMQAVHKMSTVAAA